MSRYLQRIKEYNLEFGFTEWQLKAMVEENSNLEILINRERLAGNGFINNIMSRDINERYYRTTNHSKLRFYYLQFENLDTIIVNKVTIRKKKTRNKSYGENNVFLYLFDIFNNTYNYAGTFVVRHGIKSETYLALRKYEAIYNLKKAENLVSYINFNSKSNISIRRSPI